MVRESSIKLIYTNGSSHTAAGGLEPPNDRPNSIMTHYVNEYNVNPWKHEKNVSWPSWIKSILGIDVINEAASGGGLSRLVRMTYEFIHSHWNIKDKLLLILEIPSGLRLDVFYTPLDSYLIVNPNDSGFDTNSDFYGTTQYFRETDLEKEISSKKSKDVDYYCKSFLNIHEFEQIENYHIDGLISYCKLHDIQLLITGYKSESSKINEGCVIEEYPADYCINRKMTIMHETRQGRDSHPGYFGHKEYGQYVINQLVYKGLIDESYFDLNLTDISTKII